MTGEPGEALHLLEGIETQLAQRVGYDRREAPARQILKRQARLQEAESRLEPIPFDGAAVRSYGLIVADVVHEGRKPRSRFADLLIAATAHANHLDLYSRNAEDFTGLEGLIRVVAV